MEEYSLDIKIRVLKNGKVAFVVDKNSPTLGNISMALVHLEKCKKHLLDLFDKNSETMEFKKE